MKALKSGSKNLLNLMILVVEVALQAGNKSVIDGKQTKGDPSYYGASKCLVQ